ncbi:MAG: CidA/LrgA family protein [Rhodobacteraceae bacterium]|nr:CidA/LrgA family protein [Paracoccaceae bacterium]
MIVHVSIFLLFQLAGEVTSRALDLTVPGPVLGMAYFLVFLVSAPKAAASIRPTAQGLLSHLSLLFVPAGVGVVGHLERLGSDGLPILLAIVGSTALAIIVGVLTFVGLARLMGTPDA